MSWSIATPLDLLHHWESRAAAGRSQLLATTNRSCLRALLNAHGSFDNCDPRAPAGGIHQKNCSDNRYEIVPRLYVEMRWTLVDGVDDHGTFEERNANPVFCSI